MADLVLGLAKVAVEGTLSMARSAVEEEEKLQKNVQRDLLLISDEFEMMLSFLSASNKDERVADDMTRTLVRQVRRAALDVEDCIESVLHLDNKSNWWRRLLPSCVPASMPATSLKEAVDNLELLKARVEAMGQRNMRYGLVSSKKKPADEKKPAMKQMLDNILVEARYRLNKTTTTSPKDLAELIGRGLRSSELIDKDGDGVTLQLQVISVWGTRDDSLGTTSVIKNAYDDTKVREVFKCRAWVRLMHPFSPHEFIRSLLTQFHHTNYCHHELEQSLELMMAKEGSVLIEELMKQVYRQRYLVVLEDVSTMVDWEAVKMFLPDNGKGSCVVVHTQHLDIASMCVGHSQRVLELERLSDDHSICALFKDESSKDDKDKAKTESARKWLKEFQHVGRQTNFRGLKSMVTDETLRCIPVCGIPGVGKSSLVRQVYCTMVLELKSIPFQKFGWVDVPDSLDSSELFQNLLLNLHSGPNQHCSSMLKTKDPFGECREFMQQYRCLIVINDLKSTEEWDYIKDHLVGHNHESCIIVIAQEERVARYCSNGNLWNIEDLETIEEALNFFTITDGKDEEEITKTESASKWLQEFQTADRQTNFWCLKSQMTDDTLHCISVCGIDGDDNSYLVREVYDTMIERVSFQKFGWVDVPDSFDLNELSRNLLLDLHSGSLQHANSIMRIKDSVRECRELLQQYRCFIVINDLKSTKEWDCIKAHLAGHNHQSCIIVIAHEESVARYCSKEDWWHVEGLEIEEAFDLFKITVSKKFGPWVLNHDELERARHILYMCGGLPRVIVSVGDFVANSLINKEPWSDLKHSFMETLEQNPAFGSLQPLFAWVDSYFRSCPDFLKPCIFYLSIFPVNHPIRRRRLVWRWVAEGYARDNENKSAVKNAEEFIFSLFLLSVIQGKKIGCIPYSNHRY